jgi:hypothetical protein
MEISSHDVRSGDLSVDPGIHRRIDLAIRGRHDRASCGRDRPGAPEEETIW